MKENERWIVTGLVCLLLSLWLGFLIHRSPAFPGSIPGHLIGILGSALMLVPLAYMIVKRIKPLKKAVTRLVTMRTLLTLHIYAGVIGPILVLLHSGHKFESPVGVLLTALTIIVVLSGFTGRYLMIQVTRDIREDKEKLASLNSAFNETAAELRASPEAVGLSRRFSRMWTWVFARVLVPVPESGTGPLPLFERAIRLAESVADLEYALKTHELFKRLFSRWLRFHIALSLALYALLTMHVWAELYFGLRSLS